MLSGYSVFDDDEDDDNDDDEERSRAIPSRTSIGVMSDFGEKNPWALESKRFLFGLITVQFWEYRCVLTNAQIELMCADKSRIKYSNPDKKKKTTQKDYDESVRLNMESIERIRKRKAQQAAKQQTPQ